MKNNKINRKIMIIAICGILLIACGMLFPNKKQQAKYSCYHKSGENDKIILENIYEFSYENKSIQNIQRKLVVTYKDKKEFLEAYYDQYLQNIENAPIDTKTDNKNLKKTYIWKDGLSWDKENPTLNNYIKKLEKAGYSCQAE